MPCLLMHFAAYQLDGKDSFLGHNSLPLYNLHVHLPHFNDT